jgi:hypothetical protein
MCDVIGQDLVLVDAVCGESANARVENSLSSV